MLICVFFSTDNPKPGYFFLIKKKQYSDVIKMAEQLVPDISPQHRKTN